MTLHLVTAMPQDQVHVDRSSSIVERVRRLAQKAYDSGKYEEVLLNPNTPSSRIVLRHEIQTEGFTYFFVLNQEVSFVYYFSHVKVFGVRRRFVAESLAFRYLDDDASYGALSPIFHNHVIHSAKIILSDAEYSEDGKRWWKANIAQITDDPARFGILLVDTHTSSWWLLSNAEYKKYSPSYWGNQAIFQRYRFGIYLKENEPEIRQTLGDRIKEIVF
jgi:hypothetical protein